MASVCARQATFVAKVMEPHYRHAKADDEFSVKIADQITVQRPFGRLRGRFPEIRPVEYA